MLITYSIKMFLSCFCLFRFNYLCKNNTLYEMMPQLLHEIKK